MGTLGSDAIALTTIWAQSISSERFWASILVDVDLREDQYESYPVALRTVAIARVTNVRYTQQGATQLEFEPS